MTLRLRGLKITHTFAIFLMILSQLGSSSLGWLEGSPQSADSPEVRAAPVLLGLAPASESALQGFKVLKVQVFVLGWFISPPHHSLYSRRQFVQQAACRARARPGWENRNIFHFKNTHCICILVQVTAFNTYPYTQIPQACNRCINR